MRPEALERRLVELLLIFRMSHRDDKLGALLQRTSVEVHRTIFRDKPMDMVTRGDSTRAQIQGRHNLVDALFFNKFFNKLMILSDNCDEIHAIFKLAKIKVKLANITDSTNYILSYRIGNQIVIII